MNSLLEKWSQCQRLPPMWTSLCLHQITYRRSCKFLLPSANNWVPKRFENLKLKIRHIFPSFSQLENGCSGVFVMVVSSRSPRVCCYGRSGNSFLIFQKINSFTEWFLISSDILASCGLKGNAADWERKPGWKTWLSGILLVKRQPSFFF